MGVDAALARSRFTGGCARASEAAAWAAGGVRRSLSMCGVDGTPTVCPFREGCTACAAVPDAGCVVTSHAFAPAIEGDDLWIDEAPELYTLTSLGGGGVDGSVGDGDVVVGCLRELVRGAFTRGLSSTQAYRVRPFIAALLCARDTGVCGVQTFEAALRWGVEHCAEIDSLLLDAVVRVGSGGGGDAYSRVVGLVDEGAFARGLLLSGTVTRVLVDPRVSAAERERLAGEFAPVGGAVWALLSALWGGGTVNIEQRGEDERADRCNRTMHVLSKNRRAVELLERPRVCIADATGESTAMIVAAVLGHPVEVVGGMVAEVRPVRRLWYRTRVATRTQLGCLKPRGVEGAAVAVAALVGRVRELTGCVGRMCLCTYKSVADSLVESGWAERESCVVVHYGAVRGLNLEDDAAPWSLMLTVGDPVRPPGIAELWDAEVGVGLADTLARDEIAQALGRMRTYWGGKCASPGTMVHVGRLRPSGAHWIDVEPGMLSRARAVDASARIDLERCRQAIGSVAEMANALGVNARTLQRWIAGESAAPAFVVGAARDTLIDAVR